ncbi:MAG: glycosyltransferase [Eubacterium sp.]|nr:glycosyltransferase [Eubacterium sp.]
MYEKKLSVVTVTYQAENSIKETIESVLNQDFDSYKYIVIDGGSTDKTYEIICSFDDAFKGKGIHYIHISEPDGGIFEAMNKSLKYCSGEWVYFLNAGDVIYKPDTLNKVFAEPIEDNVDVIYGGVMRRKGEKYFYRPPLKLRKLEYAMPFSHQASFVRTSIMQKYKFDISYKLAGDYDLMVRLYKEKHIFLEKDMIIAVFDLSGVSQTRLKENNMEFKMIQKKNGFYWKHFIGIHIGLLKGNRLAYALYMKLMKMRYGDLCIS